MARRRHGRRGTPRGNRAGRRVRQVVLLEMGVTKRYRVLYGDSS